jgi:hypothetical protein
VAVEDADAPAPEAAAEVAIVVASWWKPEYEKRSSRRFVYSTDYTIKQKTRTG